MFNKIANNNKKLLVVGDLILDHYIWGKSERISPEAPVPIINKVKESFLLGGAETLLKILDLLDLMLI